MNIYIIIPSIPLLSLNGPVTTHGWQIPKKQYNIHPTANEPKSPSRYISPFAQHGQHDTYIHDEQSPKHSNNPFDHSLVILLTYSSRV